MAADNDNVLSLLIQLGVVGKEDLQAATQLLNETKDSTAGLAKQMGVVNVTGADVKKILDGTAEKARTSHVAMRRLAHAMGSELPGGAALLEAGFTAAEGSMMSSTFLLIGGVELLREAMAKVNQESEQAKQLTEALAAVDAAITKTVDAQRAALEKATVAQAEFFHNYLRNAHDAVEVEARLYEARLKASFESANNQDATRKHVADRAIEDLEQRGVLSHAAALKAKEQLDLEYEARKLQRLQAQNLAEESEIQRQQANKEIRLGEDTSAESHAEGQYESATRAKAANDAALDAAKQKIASAEEVKKSLQGTGINEGTIQQLKDTYAKATGDSSGNASLSEMFHALAAINLHGGGATSALSLNPNVRAAHDIVSKLGSQGDVNLGLYEGAGKSIELAKLDLSRAQRKQAGLDIAEGNAKSDVEFYRGRMAQDRDAGQEAGDKLESTRAVHRIQEAGARADFGLDAAASILEGHATNINSFVGQVNRLANAMARMNPNEIVALARRVDTIENAMNARR